MTAHSVLEIFTVALRLGLTSFGGPVAHLGFFREEYVVRRGWLSDTDYAATVSLCQFLPGPASSQVGFAVGLRRGGLLGGLAAWLGFTLPSAVLMIGFALALGTWAVDASDGWIRGMKIAAVAVVAHAVQGMARQLCPDRRRVAIMFGALCVVVATHTAWGQVAAIAAGGVAGALWCRDEQVDELPARAARTGKRRLLALGAFCLLLAGLPLAARATELGGVAAFDHFYRAGALVFGGGHVVLPLLEGEFVEQGLVSRDAFLAGYGAAQAVPGPLFTFAGFLGASLATPPTGVAGGALGIAAVFLPSLLLVYGLLPFWDRLRGAPAAQAALRGTNAAVVGLLLAALYDPVWTSGIASRLDFAIGLACFLALAVWRVPAWAVVVLAAAAAAALRA